MKAVGLFTILFLACGTAQSQSLRVLQVQIRGGQGFPAAIQFYCTEKYSRNDCQNDIFILRQKLGRYPLEKLGNWSFIVASNKEWEAMMTQLDLPADSPVFSALKGNMTVVSQTLFSGPVDRRAEMMKWFRVPLDQLLDLAVAHELGHALCRERDEGKASVYGEQLRAGQSPACRRGEKHRRRDGNERSITTLSVADFLNMQGQRPRDGSSSNPPSKSGTESH